jgi:hypothetical protein
MPVIEAQCASILVPHDHRHISQKSAFAWAAAEPPRANLAASVLISPGRNNRPALRRNGRFSGSSGGKRRPEPHGHKSFRPSFSTSSVSTVRGHEKVPACGADDPVAALDAGLARGNPRRRLPDGSKGCLGVMVAVHDRPPRHTEQEDRSLRSAGAASRFPPERTPGHGRAPSGMTVCPIAVILGTSFGSRGDSLGVSRSAVV